MPQLEDLAATVREPEFSSNDERFAWLQDQLEEIATNYVHPIGPIREMLAAFSLEAALDAKTDRAEGWLLAARALLNALPDPDEQFYGILIASEAWALEMRYGLKNMVHFLRAMAAVGAAQDETDDESENAYQLYERLVTRWDDIAIMLENPLPDDDIVLPEWYDDPTSVPTALRLLDLAIRARIERTMTMEDRDPDLEEISKMIEGGGTYLRACYRARVGFVPFEELSAFMLAFENDWVEMVEQLAWNGSLEPGVLTTLTELEVDPKDIAEHASDLVATYRTIHPRPGTLRDYLTPCLTAVEQNA